MSFFNIQPVQRNRSVAPAMREDLTAAEVSAADGGQMARPQAKRLATSTVAAVVPAPIGRSALDALGGLT